MKLKGVVVETSGNPVRDAVVTVGSLDATTNTSGQFTITGIPTGLNIVTVMASGYDEAARTFEGSHGNEMEMNFKLRRLVQISGVVYDGTGRVAPVGTVVSLIANGEVLQDNTIDHTNGVFEFDDTNTATALVSGVFTISCDDSALGSGAAICKMVTDPYVASDDYLLTCVTFQGQSLAAAMANYALGAATYYGSIANINLTLDTLPT